MVKDLPPSQFSRGPRSNLWFLAQQGGTDTTLSLPLSNLYNHDPLVTILCLKTQRTLPGLGTTDSRITTPSCFSARQEKVSSSNCIPANSGIISFRAVLDTRGKIALQNYLNKGGNFVRIHSASDSLNTTTFFGQEVGQCQGHSAPCAHRLKALIPHNKASTLYQEGA